MINTDKLKAYFKNHATGFNNSKNKRQLCMLCQVKDFRPIRRRIKELRDSGFLIVSTAKHQGYWLFDIENHTEFESEQFRIMQGESASRRNQLRITERANYRARFPGLDEYKLFEEK